MYYGSHQTVIDDKGRITVPKKLYEAMERADHITWYITRGYRGCLYLYNLADWETLVKRAEETDLFDPRAHDFLRMIYGCAIEVRVDRQGRMPIPPTLRSVANLDRDVILVGMKNHLELWRKDAWEQYQATMGAEMESMAKELLVRGPADSATRERGERDDKH